MLFISLNYQEGALKFKFSRSGITSQVLGPNVTLIMIMNWGEISLGILKIFGYNYGYEYELNEIERV